MNSDWPTSDHSHISPTGTTSHERARSGPQPGRRTIRTAATSRSATVRIVSPVAAHVGRKFGSNPAEASAWIT